MILIARPKPIIQGSERVLRGDCRLAYRYVDEPTFRYDDLGFRVVLRKRNDEYRTSSEKK